WDARGGVAVRRADVALVALVAFDALDALNALRAARARSAPQRPLGLCVHVNGLDRAVLDVLGGDDDGRRRAACRRYDRGDECGDNCGLSGFCPFLTAARGRRSP